MITQVLRKRSEGEARQADQQHFLVMNEENANSLINRKGLGESNCQRVAAVC